MEVLNIKFEHLLSGPRKSELIITGLKVYHGLALFTTARIKRICLSRAGMYAYIHVHIPAYIYVYSERREKVLIGVRACQFVSTSSTHFRGQLFQSVGAIPRDWNFAGYGDTRQINVGNEC